MSVSSDFSINIGPALAAVQTLLASVEQSLAQMSQAAAPLGGGIFAPAQASAAQLQQSMGSSSAAVAASMSHVKVSSEAAAVAVTKAGAAAGATHAGFARMASGASRASGAVNSFRARAMAAFRTAGEIGHGIAGIHSGLEAVTKLFNRFRDARRPVQQAGAAVQQQGQQAQAATAPNRNYAGTLVRITAVAGATAAAVWGVHRAIRAVRGVKMPEVPRMPSGGLSGGAGGVSGAIGGITGMIAGPVGAIAASITAAIAGAMGGGLIASSLNAAMDDEQLQVSMEVLVGGQDRAKAVLDDLKRRSDVSPFQSTDYTAAGRALIAFGEEAEQVGATLDRIADITSGIGGKSAAFGDIAEIYGKARVQGQLFAEDINQLTGRGIPVIAEFAKVLGVSESQVKKLASQGQVTFPVLEQAFINLTSEGGKFNGMMGRIGATNGGLLSTIKDKLHGIILEFGKPINDAIRPILAEAIELLSGFKDEAAQMGQAIATGIKIGVAAFQELGTGGMMTVIGDGLQLAFQSAVNTLFAGLQAAIATVSQGLTSAVGVALTLLSYVTTGTFWKGLSDVFTGVAAMFHAALQQALASLLDGIKAVPGMGKLVGNLPDLLRQRAEQTREGGQARFDGAGADLDRVLSQADHQVKEMLSSLGPAFAAAFANAGNYFDTDALKQRIMSAFDLVQKRFAENAAAAKKVADAAAGAGEEPKNAPVEAKRPAATPGMFASAVNLLMGRSPMELVLDEARLTNNYLRQIEQNTGKLPSKPAAPPREAKVIDMTPRFV